ncbi:hypothetical protein NE237_015053 [Protea cynaroides]|uniref:Uncharacterized protein n=1 Tax=Protea cynaroides TaxID=273540 RepID=A0A9Q0QQN8_9MAGN|nr:hypothetical protein NE237_015053 [Protea cynaroides]
MIYAQRCLRAEVFVDFVDRTEGLNGACGRVRQRRADLVGKHETPKFNFRSTFRGAKTEDKGKAFANPDSSKKQKVIPYTPSSKGITIGSQARTAPASSDVDIDLCPINISDGLPIIIANGVELKSHPLVNEPSSSTNREPGCSEVLKTLSVAESSVLDLSKEKENTIAKRRKVFVEREKAIEEKEKFEAELRELKEEKLTFSTQLNGLREEKLSLESRLKESTGSVASKKALFELFNFMEGKHPGFDFSNFIVDFNALTPPTPHEDDGVPAPTNGGSNMEVDTSEAVDRRWLSFKRTLTSEGSLVAEEIHFSSAESCKLAKVSELSGDESNIPLTMAILITNLEALRAENDELRSRGGPSSLNNSLNLQLLSTQNECNALKEEPRKLKEELDSQVETTMDLLFEHEALSIENIELREALKAQAGVHSSPSKKTLPG